MRQNGSLLFLQQLHRPYSRHLALESHKRAQRVLYRPDLIIMQHFLFVFLAELLRSKSYG